MQIRLVSSSNQDLLQFIRKGDLSRASAVIEDNKRILLDVMMALHKFPLKCTKQCDFIFFTIYVVT
jgi:hypothetical protein